jgi:hypothetical protein
VGYWPQITPITQIKEPQILRAKNKLMLAHHVLSCSAKKFVNTGDKAV